jgi:branched-chain amino acid aminotransferase
MKRIDLSNYVEALSALRKPWHAKYHAMYSSLLGGVVTDPLLMQVPVDDHLVHRGDGVFDTFACEGRAAYNLGAHLERLVRSAATIGLAWPGGLEELRSLALQTLSAAGRDACFCRVVLARGPGGLGVSPYESPEPALYIIVYAAAAPFMRTRPDGASVRRSTVPVKAYSTVKHCNYLPNVLMKREAVDWGADFAVSFDDRGRLAEGATENVGIVTRDGALLFPRLEAVLAGTTMLRVMQLAESLVASGTLASVSFGDIRDEDVRAAVELLMVGTPIRVACACTYEGEPVGDGRPGPVGLALNRLLDRDIAENAALRTPY